MNQGKKAKRQQGTESESYRDQAVKCVPFSGTDGESRTVVLAPDGRVESTVGTFIMDASGAAEIIAAFDRHGVEVPIDYDHQTLGGAFAAPDGKAPAAGWITGLAYESGRGLLADVRWNAETRDLIRGGQYKYLSPVLSIRKSDRRAVGLHSAALTNKPAIPAMERLAASEHTETEQMTTTDVTAGPIVDMGDIAGLLGVELIRGGAATLPARCHAKIKEILADDAVAIAGSVREALGLNKDADSTAVLIAFGKTCASTIRDLQQDADLKDFLQPYVLAGVLRPTSKKDFHVKDYQEVLALAATSRTAAKKLLDQRLGMIPPFGKVGMDAPTESEKSDRRTVIVNAMRDFDADPRTAKLTTRKAFANVALMDAGLETLQASEMLLIEKP